MNENDLSVVGSDADLGARAATTPRGAIESHSTGRQIKYPQLIGDFHFTSGEKWKYQLVQDTTVYFPDDDFGYANLADPCGTVRIQLRGNYVTILKGYAWDGCSMVPTQPFMLLPSLYHDAFGQFRQLPCLKPRLTGKRWNTLFRQMGLERGGRVIPYVYWLGLVLFNPAYQLVGEILRPQPQGKCLPV